MSIPHFRIPLDLPHAGTIANRIARLLTQRSRSGEAVPEDVLRLANDLEALLVQVRADGENPVGGKAVLLQGRAAQLGRRLVDAIEGHGLGEDRLGQCVRNLFECLELGEEGAMISLRAGENPNSAQRPV